MWPEASCDQVTEGVQRLVFSCHSPMANLCVIPLILAHPGPTLLPGCWQRVNRIEGAMLEVPAWVRSSDTGVFISTKGLLAKVSLPY